MNVDTKAPYAEKEVATFPGWSLQHIQKQGSVKEELKRSGRRFQVMLKLRDTRASKCAFGRSH